ncbi:hypothetical protein RsTz2092_05140 [Deferribacterales bacterium RsTz2092]|nr:hypothetical protein AGMMS49941_03970 [Deferribacterales bacterium]
MARKARTKPETVAPINDLRADGEQDGVPVAQAVASVVYPREAPSSFMYNPVLIDYNFADKRPRGGSACFDFFACGRLCTLVNELDESLLVYVSKEEIAPTQGFFLMDFAQVNANPNILIEAIKGLKLTHLYVEDSANHSLKDVLKTQKKLFVSYVQFKPATRPS